MKVLIIGSGGREHAIAYALHKSNKVSEIHAIPGNPGISKIGFCHNGSVTDFDYILKFVEEKDIYLTIVGPEVPLCLGLANLLESKGHKVFGPSKEASKLEGSKIFSKEFMMKYNIPTAKYQSYFSYDDAIQSLDSYKYPLVVKADGLAAGKGVVICNTKNDAKNAIKELMLDGILDNAGNNLILEEFLTGYECSLLCFTDGETIIPMVSSKDHKQIFDGNLGPNTGGMGTISPNPFLDEERLNKIFDQKILRPFIKGLKEENLDYRGVIFIGLMINGDNVDVLEFNVRFGDPETQSILLRLDTDLFDIFEAVCDRKLDTIDIKWKKEHSGCVVLASKGYPNNYEKGKLITGLDNISDDIIIFHAGTKFNGNDIYTNGGRVLNVCALGNSLEDVRNKIYNAIKVIDFEGIYYRKDIGLI